MKKYVGSYVLLLALVVALSGILTNGNISNVAYAATEVTNQQTLSKPNLKVTSRTATTANLKIGTVSNATGYKIYRSTKIGGPFEYVGYSKSNSFKDTGLNASTTYYYRARAYKNLYNKKIHSKYSSVVSLKGTLNKPAKITAASKSNKAVISFSGVSLASGYKVYRSSSKNGTYNYIGKTLANTYTDANVMPGATYYYRVRAYRNSGETLYNGVYSSKVAVKITNQASNNGGSTGNDSSSENDSSTQNYAKKVIELVNKERAKEGLSKLSTTTALTNAAQKRAKETVSSFSHTRPDGSSFSSVLKEYDISYRMCGENIAYGQKTPEKVVEAWMNSPGHRANIMKSGYGKIGVGCYVSNGVIYWTQLFTN